MISVPGGVRVWLATGPTDMRKGFNGLALLVQEMLERDPHSGQLFVFRGRRGDLIKVLWHDGQGLCLFAKRLERGRCDTGPVIWRQVEVPTSVTLEGLHDIVQAAMGWFDYHLWEFTIGRQRYGLPMDDDCGTEPRIEASKVRLRDVLKA